MSLTWRLLRRLPALAAATVIIASSNPADQPVHLDIRAEAHTTATPGDNTGGPR